MRAYTGRDLIDGFERQGIDTITGGIICFARSHPIQYGLQAYRTMGVAKILIDNVSLFLLF